MSAFVIRRLMQSIAVVLVMSLIVFFGVNIVGDPVDMLINPEADQADIEAAIRALGLDRPAHEQYWYFLANAFKGDLGRSFIFGQPALQLIVQRMPATLRNHAAANRIGALSVFASPSRAIGKAISKEQRRSA